MELILILIALGVFVIWKLFKIKSTYFRLSSNTITAFTGGPGTGKTKNGVDVAVANIQRAVLVWKVRKLAYNIFLKWYRKESFKPSRPNLYSNIPIDVKYYVPLRVEHLINVDLIVEYSVVFVDEVGDIASQHDWKEEVVQIDLLDHFRFCRHWYDGKLIICDQSQSNIAKVIRDRVGTIYYLNNWRKWNILFYLTLKKVLVSHSEVIEIMNAEGMITTKDGSSNFEPYLLWGLNFGKPKYASRAYRYTYKAVPSEVDIPGKPESLYTNERLTITELKNVRLFRIYTEQIIMCETMSTYTSIGKKLANDLKGFILTKEQKEGLRLLYGNKKKMLDTAS